MFGATLMNEDDPSLVFDDLTKSPKSAILIAVCASPLFFLFTYFGDPGRGRAAAICAFVILLCGRIFWSLRRLALFWLALTIVALGQVPFIVLIRWTDRDYPGVVLLPVAFLDFAIVYGVFKLVEKITSRRRQART
jgi:hypothetical protein